MTSIRSLIHLQSDFNNIKGEYELWNTWMECITSEMADYPAMYSYLEENNPHYLLSLQIQKSL
jgi:hypothetical protein